MLRTEKMSWRHCSVALEELKYLIVSCTQPKWRSSVVDFEKILNSVCVCLEFGCFGGAQSATRLCNNRNEFLEPSSLDVVVHLKLFRVQVRRSSRATDWLKKDDDEKTKKLKGSSHRDFINSTSSRIKRRPTNNNQILDNSNKRHHRHNTNADQAYLAKRVGYKFPRLWPTNTKLATVWRMYG